MLLVDGFRMVLPKSNSSLGEVGSEEQTYFPSLYQRFAESYMASVRLLKLPQYHEDGIIRLLKCEV